MTYKILGFQSLVDVACELSGTVDGVFDLMKENDYVFDLDFATEPKTNTEILVPVEFENKTKEIADYFSKTNQNIATAEEGLLIADFSLDFNLDFVS